jgi:hypothetical protein
MQEEIAIGKGITIPTVCLAHKRSIKFQSNRRHAQGATSSWKALVTLVERGGEAIEGGRRETQVSSFRNLLLGGKADMTFRSANVR